MPALRRARWPGVLHVGIIAALTIALLPAVGFAKDGPVSATFDISAGRLHVGEAAKVAIAVTIVDGWHINSHQPGQDFLIPTSLAFELPDGMSVAEVDYPEPVVRRLRFGGSRDLLLYEGKVIIRALLRYDSVAERASEPVALLRYQACNDTLCLRPTLLRIPLDVELSTLGGITHAGFNEEAAEKIAKIVAGGLWVVIPAMLLLGLALNLTPCVYPLISVTVAYFGRQAAGKRARRLWLALSYTLGIAVTFSVLGVSAALSGGFFGQALSNPVVLVAVAGLMVALALSSFGLYQIRLPEAWSSRLGRAGSGAIGSYFMGMTMGLVAAPCVGPVIVGLLVFVGSRGDVLLGFGLFFLLALGFGIPYVALAFAAGSLSVLPRSGAWLRWTEHVFGCVLLAMAIYFLGPVLPAALDGFVMPTFLVLAVAYLAFLDPAGVELRGFVAVRRAAGVLALAAVAFIYLPARASQHALAWKVFSAETYDEARASGRPFVIEFGADWCIPCREMEEKTFTDPGVIAAARGMTFLSVDMTTSSRMMERILESFDVFGAPTTLFFGPDGKEWTRRIGYVGAKDFTKLLEQSRHPPREHAALLHATKEGARP